MDIIRDEFIAIGRLETDMPMRIYTQCGTYMDTKKYQGYFKRDPSECIQKLIDIEFMQKIFSKYTCLMKDKLLKTEVKICFEKGYKVIKADNNLPIRINVERYSVNFAVWSVNGNRYDRGFGNTGNPEGIRNLEDEFECLYKLAEEESNQEQLKSGFYDIIFDSEATGLLAHEIVGHCMEADIWESNDEIKKLFAVNRRVASPQVSIYDDPNYPYGFGSYQYDDEGVKAKKVTLISNGVVSEYMTSIATANAQSTQSNGHARATTYKYRPIVRMSNTYFLPKQTSVQQLFSSMDKGLYLCGAGESRGGVNFAIRFPVCYAVCNGKVQCRVSNARLLGKLELVLANIVDVAEDFKIYGGGDGGCGKFGQWPIAVSAGGPHIRVNRMFVLNR